MSARVSHCLVSLVVLWTTAGFAARDCLAARIEAVKGKSYHLTNQHGPWMIMVATFHTTAADGQTVVGKSPEQAANELVYELRKIGFPAYTYEAENEPEFVTTRDRLGQEVRKRNLRRVKSLCVLAGNYPSLEADIAQESLEWVKGFNPKSLQDGVVFRPTKTRPLPLSGAFLCINPLLSPEEVAARQNDPLLKQLNSGVRHSLVENPGEYTLVVAYFAGKQLVTQQDSQEFLKDNDLDYAAVQANELAIALRQDLDPQHRFRNLDAYVWHDRDQSMVTVGSFSSRTDPKIEHYRKLFAATLDAKSGQFAPRYLAIPGGGQPRVWAFMPTPQVMPVPRLH